ncbi:hypothetical protein FEZ53_06455 [Staphylococcus xylosus]|uniref:Uncharacterized protein n=2 Tax=Staphylococcus xylosus TaxID=1288 RepID=A0A5R9B8F7_STAXY|nr:hypothetical protein FEZ53_06455 [Staphylococcus xylosus]
MWMIQKYEYVIYKGDEIICGGTRKECAEKLEVSEELISVMATNSHKKRIQDKALYAEKVNIAEIEKELAL